MERVYCFEDIIPFLFQRLVLMIKPHDEVRAVGFSNNIGVFDPVLEDARTPMMNGKTVEEKV